jgi:inositol transport system permease protein
MKNRLVQILNKYSLYLVLVLLVLFFSIATEGFFTVPNAMSMLTSWSIKGLIALGVGMVIISRGIDLSSGSVVALASVVAASFAQNPEVSKFGMPPVFVAVVLASLVGVVIGACNGAFVAYTKIPPFIATLGAMTVARGLALMYTKGFPVSQLREDFMILGRAMVGPVPLLAIYFLVAAGAVWVILNHTAFGKNIYAIGGNENAARVSGVSVELNLVAVYTIAAFLAAFGGMLMAARTAAGNATYGNMYELDAIAAVTVGGISHSGGLGTVSGMVAGIMILAVVENGLILLGVSPYLQQVVKGCIIVGAVIYDMSKHKRR